MHTLVLFVIVLIIDVDKLLLVVARLVTYGPMWWVNRFLYNNDKLKPIASVGGVNVTSAQAIGEERL